MFFWLNYNFKKSYNESLQNGTIKDIFDALKVHEVVQFLDSGQKLVSIQDKNKRIHQFLVPKDKENVQHSHYHSVVKSLLKYADPDDLPYEYEKEIKKYIRVGFPEYNCLT